MIAARLRTGPIQRSSHPQKAMLLRQLNSLMISDHTKPKPHPKKLKIPALAMWGWLDNLRFLIVNDCTVFVVLEMQAVPLVEMSAALTIY